MNINALNVPKDMDILELMSSGIDKTDFWIHYGKDHFANKKIHVRAVLDEGIIVFREWLKHEKRWGYQIKSVYYFEYLVDSEHLYILSK